MRPSTLITLGLSVCAVVGADEVPAPHPQITEVLFNVPAEAAGDANRDGTRHAAGDEFIEIANPHDISVNLKGYVLFNRRSSFAGTDKRGVRFAFPEVELPPHTVCLVFNACEADLPTPFGTESLPPDGGNPRFNGVLLFSMQNTSKQRALNNTGDWIALAAPDGTILDVVSWGSPDPPPPPSAGRHQRVDADPKGSVQRLSPTTDLEQHRAINGDPFSPGIIPDRSKKPAAPSKRKR